MECTAVERQPQRAIERGDGNDELSRSLRKMLRNGEGPFKFNLHSFRDVRQAAVVQEFDEQATEKYEDVVAKLREHCWLARGFCSNALDVYVAFNRAVAPGFGGVCNTSRLLGKTVTIQDKTSWKYKIISLEHHFEACIDDDHKNRDTFIQMNPDDGQYVFGVVPDREIKAVALVSPPGYVPKAEILPEQIKSDRGRSIAGTQ
jgi:hypothetical protein